jgi:hypothetical protein
MQKMSYFGKSAVIAMGAGAFVAGAAIALADIGSAPAPSLQLLAAVRGEANAGVLNFEQKVGSIGQLAQSAQGNNAKSSAKEPANQKTTNQNNTSDQENKTPGQENKSPDQEQDQFVNFDNTLSPSQPLNRYPVLFAGTSSNGISGYSSSSLSTAPTQSGCAGPSCN